MIGSGFESCRNDLLKFRASLPPELELTPDNILARRDTNQLNQLLTGACKPVVALSTAALTHTPSAYDLGAHVLRPVPHRAPWLA